MTNAFSKIAKATLGVLVAAGMVASAVPALALTASDISMLQAAGIISASQAASLMASLGTSTTTTGTCYAFTTPLAMGQTSEAVKQLQMVLNSNASTALAVPAGSNGSAGHETTYFGAATKTAVMKYQGLNGLEQVGSVGPQTRLALNKCTTTGPVTTGPGTGTTGPVAVMLSVDNPSAGYILNTQAGADLAHFTFTGSGTVNSVTLHRTGISNQNTLTNVYLYDGVTRLTSGYSFNTNGDIVMNNLGIMVNGSKTISVKADVASDAATYGSTVGVALTSFTAGSTATTANVMGNMMFLGVGTLSGANFTTTSPSPSNSTVNAGSVGQNLWSQNLNVSTHAAKLHALTLKMIGSAPTTSLSNVSLFVDGVNVASATINANMQFVFNLGSNAVNLTTGSHLIEVHGDVVGGAYRNFYLSLEQGTDVSIEDGQNMGVYINPTYLTLTATNVNGGTVTINPGTLTINQDTSFNTTTTLVGGATNVQMAAYKFTSYGEDVKVNSLTFTPVFTGLSTGTTLQNVGLYVNGGQVGSNQTATNGTGTLVFNNLGTQLILPVGTPVTVTIKGDVVSNNPINTPVTSGTVRFDLVTGSNNAQGVSSSQLTNTPAAGGQSLTIASTNVTFAATTGFATTTIAPNQSHVKIGSFTLSTGSAEGVNVNQISVALAGTLVPQNQLTNLTVQDDTTGAGTVIGNVIGNPTTSGNIFSTTSMMIPARSSRTIGVYATIGSGASGYTVTPSMTITYRGATSNLSSTTSTIAGSASTAGVAMISNSTGTSFVAGSSPVSQFVIGGTSGLAIATFNVKTSNNVGGAIINDMTFTAPYSPDTISSVTVNGQTQQMNAGTATIYNVGLTVPSSNAGLDIPVTVSLVCAASTGCTGVANTDVNLTLASYTFQNGTSIATVTPSSPVVSATHKLVTTKPSVTVAPSSTNGFGNGTYQVGTVTVTADAAGSLKLEKLPIVLTVSGSGSITGTSVELRDSTGSSVIAGVSPLSGTGTFVFTAPRTISAGGSETYTVYASYTGVSGAAGTQSTTFSLGPKDSFRWTDVAGNVSDIHGTYINSYSTNSQTKTN